MAKYGNMFHNLERYTGPLYAADNDFHAMSEGRKGCKQHVYCVYISDSMQELHGFMTSIKQGIDRYNEIKF